MTSRERVRRAIEYRTVDRVPTYFQATPYVWDQLKGYLGLETEDQILEHYQIDIRTVAPVYVGPERTRRQIGPTDYEEEGLFGEVRQYRWNGIEYNATVVHHPLAEAGAESDVDRLVDRPRPDWYDYRSVSRQLDRYRDRGIIFGHWGPFQTSTFLRAEGDLYMDLALNPDLAHRIFDRMHRFQMEHYRQILEAGEGRIDILRTHDDYGTQQSTLFSMEMWHAFFEDHTRELVELAHDYGAFFQQHSCGAIRDVIPSLLDCGIDSLEPLQPVAGMDPESLKAEFGRRLCYVGGIDTQYLLPRGSAEDVRREVRRYIDVLNDDGGYILYPSQAWESCVPIANIEALYSVRS